MFFVHLHQILPSCSMQIILFCMDTVANNALRALNSINVRHYTELQCPKARRRRLKAVQRLVRVLLGDPTVMCVTNTKGEVSLSGGSCTAHFPPLGGHLALTAQEHEALSMLHMACSMHLSQQALLRMPRRCTQRDLISPFHRHNILCSKCFEKRSLRLHYHCFGITPHFTPSR